MLATDNTEHILRLCGTELESEVFGCLWSHRQHTGYDLHAANLTSLLQKTLLGTLHCLSLELLYALLHRLVLLDVFAYYSLQVLGIMEESLDSLHAVLQVIHHLLAGSACLSLDTTDAGGNAALGNDLQHTDATGAVGVDTTTELNTRTKLHHADPVAVFLTEQCYSSELLSLLYRHVAMILQRDVLTDHIVDDTLNLTDFLVGYLLEMSEVETQCVWRHE